MIMFGKRILILAAHPDDEVVACCRRHRPRAGARRRDFRAFPHPWLHRAGNYVAVGSQELRKARCAPPRRKRSGRAISRHRAAWLVISALRGIYGARWQRSASEIEAAIAQNKIDQIWVPAYEGGNADHDALNAVGSLLRVRFNVLEFAEYNYSGGKAHSQQFPHPNARSKPSRSPPPKRKRSAAALALYKSEQEQSRLRQDRTRMLARAWRLTITAARRMKENFGTPVFNGCRSAIRAWISPIRRSFGGDRNFSKRPSFRLRRFNNHCPSCTCHAINPGTNRIISRQRRMTASAAAMSGDRPSIWPKKQCSLPARRARRARQRKRCRSPELAPRSSWLCAKEKLCPRKWSASQISPVPEDPRNKLPKTAKQHASLAAGTSSCTARSSRAVSPANFFHLSRNMRVKSFVSKPKNPDALNDHQPRDHRHRQQQAPRQLQQPILLAPI